jgi:isopentenyl phosphate kinase
MRDTMIILKLGGSILTEKDSSVPKVNHDILNMIAIEIKNYLTNVDDSRNNVDNSLIIVHGAGSFGHPTAKKYKIGTPFNSDEYNEKRIGFSLTQNHVKKLNNIICSVFVDYNIPCVSIQSSAIITSKNKRINNFNLELIKKYLEEGFIPVFYGDVVLDDDIKIAVISGDQILTYLAKHLKSNKVILGTDVDGVYNKNPKKYDDAKLIKCLSSLDDLDQLDSTTNIDVTGGMVGKISELLELAKYGVESKIVNATISGIITKALEDKNVRGTLVTNSCSNKNDK